MADISVTAANVEGYDTVTTNSGIAGVTITAGQTVYIEALNSNKLHLADSNAANATAQVAGVALHGALAGQPLTYATGGDIDIGATLTTAAVYVQSGTAGGVAPVADLSSGQKTTIIGVALAADKLHLILYNSNVATA